MSTDSVKRAYRTREQWAEIIEAQRQSNVSVEAFCQERGLTPSAFYNWRRKLGARQDGPASQNSGFFEVDALALKPSLTWDMELELAPGIIFRLRRS